MRADERVVTAFIGIGSNLDNPLLQVQTALRELAELPNTELIQSSSLYRTPPMGPPGQPDYINAVVELATALGPIDLLDQLQALEATHGRVRDIHWGPRTLDLDLLLYGNQAIYTARLSVPHPGIAERPFVVLPLAEIAPTLEIPSLGPISALRAALHRASIVRL